MAADAGPPACSTPSTRVARSGRRTRVRSKTCCGSSGAGSPDRSGGWTPSPRLTGPRPRPGSPADRSRRRPKLVGPPADRRPLAPWAAQPGARRTAADRVRELEDPAREAEERLRHGDRPGARRPARRRRRPRLQQPAHGHRRERRGDPRSWLPDGHAPAGARRRASRPPPRPPPSIARQLVAFGRPGQARPPARSIRTGAVPRVERMLRRLAGGPLALEVLPRHRPARWSGPTPGSSIRCC